MSALLRSTAAGLCVALAACGGCGQVASGRGESIDDGDAGGAVEETETCPTTDLVAELFTETRGTVRALASDADHLYWLEDIYSGDREFLRFKRLPFAGGTPEQLIEIWGEGQVVGGLTVRGDALYWMQCDAQDRRVVYRARRTEGLVAAPVFEESFGDCSGQLRISDEGLWLSAWANYLLTGGASEGGIALVGFDAKSPSVMTWGEHTVSLPSAFELLPQHVVFVSGEGSIYLGPRSGPPSLARRIKVAGDCVHVAADGSRAYVGSGPLADRPFVIMVPEEGDEKTVYLGPLGGHMQALAANAEQVFWSEDGTIHRMRAGGGAACEVLHGELTWRLHATDRSLFWAKGKSIQRATLP